MDQPTFHWTRPYSVFATVLTMEILGLKGLDLMERLQERFLRQATFEGQEAEYHIITPPLAQQDSSSSDDDLKVSEHCSPRHEHFWDGKQNKDLSSILSDSTSARRDITPGTLTCILQRTRPHHVGGQMDSLPFEDAKTVRKIFRALDLPASYFQIADGSVATASASIFRDSQGNPHRYELVAHCLTKQGDWAMAISHRMTTRATSVFLSVDQRVNSEVLTDDLQLFADYAIHPMLLPCMILSATFQTAVHRRHVIKGKVDRLEKVLNSITSRQMPAAGPDSPYLASEEESDSIAHLFELLQSCRKDQASRKGRADFWQSYFNAMERGFSYSKEIQYSSPDQRFAKVHEDLKHWMEITRQRLQSLTERDKDHINRVDNLSHMLYNLVQQRDMRLQSSIARASQRDSEDMKFLAILGSVFLPASLVATILNVPEFQFLPGGKLFGAYIGITVPLIVLVVVVCITRPYFKRWRRTTGYARARTEDEKT